MSTQGWEGLGGPVRVDPYRIDDIDPTLDSCCRREEESNRRGNALRQTLQRHDIVAETERRRRNLVSLSSFQGCRCCYDPNSDGGEYRTLMELRQKEDQMRAALPDENDDGEEKKNADFKEDEGEDSDDEFDYLLDEDLPEENEELKLLEERRRAELETEMLEREVVLQHGYGTLRQMHPSRVLKAAGLAPGTRDPPRAVVLHLVDPDSMVSASLDLFLEKLASKSARGTVFLRSGGRATLLMDAGLASKVLPRMNPEKDLPALIAVRDGVVVNSSIRLQGLADDTTDMIVESAVEEWLSRSGAIVENAPRLESVCRIRPEEEALMDYLVKQKPSPQEEERFECGVAGCHKFFPHEHVGVQTEHQKGLLVSAEEVEGRD